MTRTYLKDKYNSSSIGNVRGVTSLLDTLPTVDPLNSVCGFRIVYICVYYCYIVPNELKGFNLVYLGFVFGHESGVGTI